jgi:hypothetical protein
MDASKYIVDLISKECNEKAKVIFRVMGQYLFTEV